MPNSPVSWVASSRQASSSCNCLPLNSAHKPQSLRKTHTQLSLTGSHAAPGSAPVSVPYVLGRPFEGLDGRSACSSPGLLRSLGASLWHGCLQNMVSLTAVTVEQVEEHMEPFHSDSFELGQELLDEPVHRTVHLPCCTQCCLRRNPVRIHGWCRLWLMTDCDPAQTEHEDQACLWGSGTLCRASVGEMGMLTPWLPSSSCRCCSCASREYEPAGSVLFGCMQPQQERRSL